MVEQARAKLKSGADREKGAGEAALILRVQEGSRLGTRFPRNQGHPARAARGSRLLMYGNCHAPCPVWKMAANLPRMPNASSLRTAMVATERFLGQAGPLLVVLTAAVYYALYYRAGLNLGGEGGTNAILALRLMEGQRPIADTFLGYNLLWFYPLIALFKVTGPDYVAMRIFFFVLCTINALLGYAIVRSVTRQAWLALAVSILLVLVPGMIFRNYMGLIGVLSSLLLLKAYVLPAATTRGQIGWMAAAGAGMSICFLLRIEPSFLLAVVWLGLAVLYPFGPRRDCLPRLRTTLVGTAAGVAILLAVHTGAAWHAQQRGFGEQFVGQYSTFLGMLGYELSRETEKLLPDSAPSAAAAPSRPGTATAVATESAPAEAREARLARPPLGKIWEAPRPRDRYFGLCLYYPVFWGSTLVGAAAVMLALSVLRGDADTKQKALVILTATGCSLSLFPQYFWFRPDAPHLSEFMVPFLPAVAVSSWAVWSAAYTARTRAWRFAAAAVITLSALLVPIYLKAIMPREDAGTIFSMREPTRFRALNGVDVVLSPADAAAIGGLRDAVLNHSSPGEFVVVYPYAPTINFMTDRPSYEYNLYVDDSTADDRFQREARERIELHRPAVIVIDNRPINRTDRSRFKNWASDLMSYITSSYRPAGTFQVGRREIEVYARPDKQEPPAF